MALKVTSSKLPIGVGIITNFDTLQIYRNSGENSTFGEILIVGAGK